MSAGKVDAVTKFLVLPLSVVGHRVRVTKKREIMDGWTTDIVFAGAIEIYQSYEDPDSIDWIEKDSFVEGFERGVKWQAEKSARDSA